MDSLYGVCGVIVLLLIVAMGRVLANHQPEFSARLARPPTAPQRILKVDGRCYVQLNVVARRVLAKAKPGRVQIAVILDDAVEAVRIVCDGRRSVPLRLPPCAQEEEVPVGEFRGVRVTIRRPAPLPTWRLADTFDAVHLSTGAMMHCASRPGHSEVVLFVPGKSALFDTKKLVDRALADGKNFAVLYYRAHTYTNRHEPEALDCAFASGSLEPAVEDLHCAIRALRGRRIRLVGYSLGGLIATLLVTRHAPLEISDMILVSPFLCGRKYSGVHPLCAWMLVSAVAPFLPTFHGHSVLKMPALYKQSLTFGQANVFSPLRDDAHLMRALPAVTTTFVSALSKAATELELWARTSNLPVLLISSGNDNVVSSRDSAKVAKKLFVDLRCADVPFGGHWPLAGLLSLDAAAQCRELMFDFWDRQISNDQKARTRQL